MTVYFEVDKQTEKILVPNVFLPVWTWNKQIHLYRVWLTWLNVIKMLLIFIKIKKLQEDENCFFATQTFSQEKLLSKQAHNFVSSGRFFVFFRELVLKVKPGHTHKNYASLFSLLCLTSPDTFLLTATIRRHIVSIRCWMNDQHIPCLNDDKL